MVRSKRAAEFAAILLLSALPSLAQKKASPSAPKKVPNQAVRFQGAPQYSQEELLAAAGMKPGVRPSTNDVKARAKQLIDTGLFAVVKYSNDSKGLIFTLTPAPQLYTVYLDNLPIQPGKQLDDELHERFPLYHGQVPAHGSTLDGICQALHEMLAAEGVNATVKADLTSGLGPQKITAMDFKVTSQAVKIGPIQIAGVSAAMQARANGLAGGQTGNDYDAQNTAAGLQRAFEDLYQDQGYAAIQVTVTQTRPFVISDQAIGVPFSVAITEGGVYKLGTVEYPADALVPRAEVEKILSKYPAGSGSPVNLFLLAVRDAYHARGYLDCSIVPHPSYNETTHIVNYRVDIAQGELYQMAAVQFDGAPEAMAVKLKNAWKLAPGSAFDESYVSGFAAAAQKKDKPLTKWMQTVIMTYDIKPDPATHEVNCIFHFAKAAQSGR
jgi:outer membrane protein assembly factor BamA